MPEKSAKATKAAAKTTKAAPKKRTSSPRSKRRAPDHAAIAERAYFIYLEEGGQDAASNWLRAERELTLA